MNVWTLAIGSDNINLVCGSWYVWFQCAYVQVYVRMCEWMCVCVIHRMYAYGIVSECSEWEYVNVVLISFSTNWNERKRHEHRNKREIYNNNNNKPHRKNLRNNNSNNRSWSSLVDVVNLVCSVILFHQNNTNWSILWLFGQFVALFSILNISICSINIRTLSAFKCSIYWNVRILFDDQS